MIVLASASPRRQELLRNAGISFAAEPANIPEIRLTGELPADFAIRMAREKALAVSSQSPEAYVLGADTVVVTESEVLGKPRDQADAVRMLELLSGRTHSVITGVCLLRGGGSESQVPESHVEDIRCETTLVKMREISHADIVDYVASGEPMDKAGAYAIQGRASRWMWRIEGDYFNVVGLPISLVYTMLRKQNLV